MSTSYVDITRRLLANVEAGKSDQSDAPMKVPASSYRDPQRWQQEIERIFHRVPLIVSMSVDIPEPGDYHTLEIAARPILVVRGDDGVARTFLNMCRHRGAQVAPEGCDNTRRFTCPYHAWVYDTKGALVGVPGQDLFGEVDVSGLIELPTAERVGLVLAILTPGLDLDPDAWLGGMTDALRDMELDRLHRYPVVTELESPNWKVAADGYVDGYHIGYLHKRSIGEASITNRNTFDFFGPHQRIGFAQRDLLKLKDIPEEEWDGRTGYGLVHFIFPNVSMAGLPGNPLMVSRLLPGPTSDRSRTLQYHYFREPLVGDEAHEKAEERRVLFERVVADEDYATGFKITRGLGALGDDHFRFGRNERGNQHLHQSIDALVNGAAVPA